MCWVKRHLWFDVQPALAMLARAVCLRTLEKAASLSHASMLWLSFPSHHARWARPPAGWL